MFGNTFVLKPAKPVSVLVRGSCGDCFTADARQRLPGTQPAYPCSSLFFHCLYLFSHLRYTLFSYHSGTHDYPRCHPHTVSIHCLGSLIHETLCTPPPALGTICHDRPPRRAAVHRGELHVSELDSPQRRPLSRPGLTTQPHTVVSRFPRRGHPALSWRSFASRRQDGTQLSEPRLRMLARSDAG